MGFLLSSAVCPAAPSVPEWAPVIDVAAGNGTRGPWRQNNSHYDFVDDAAVAVNDAGFVAVAWADLPNHDIRLMLYSPEREPLFEEPANVSRSPGIFSWIPKLAISAGNSADEITVHAIWQDIVFRGGGHGGEIFSAVSRNGGRSFEPPINLSDVIEGSGKGRTDPQRWSNGSYDLVLSPDGTVYAAWTEYEGRLWFSRSEDGGRTFIGKSHLAGGGDDSPARAPSLAAASGGRVFLAYTTGDTDTAPIHLLRSEDAGRNFAAPVTARSSPGSYADAPAIAIDRAGNLHLIHSENAGGPYGRPRLRHAVLMKGQDAFKESEDGTSGSIIGHGPAAAAAYPMLRIDGKDRLWVAWEHFPDHPGRPRGIGWSRSDDLGRTFSSAALVPGLGGPVEDGFNGSQQGLLGGKFDVSPNGRIAVANSLFVPERSSRIRLRTARQ